MQTVTKKQTRLLTGIVIAFIATPGLAAQKNEGRMNPREQAIHDCTTEAVGRYKNQDASAQQRAYYRACMGMHGQDQE
jgi:hypothetical protein